MGCAVGRSFNGRVTIRDRFNRKAVESQGCACSRNQQ